MCLLSIALSFYLVDAWTDYKIQMASNISSFIIQPWATSHVGCVKHLFLTYLLKICVSQRMCCLIICFDSQVHIDYNDASDEEKEKTMNKNPRKKLNQLLEKLYYELDCPSALGGVQSCIEPHVSME